MTEFINNLPEFINNLIDALRNSSLTVRLILTPIIFCVSVMITTFILNLIFDFIIDFIFVPIGCIYIWIKGELEYRADMRNNKKYIQNNGKDKSN